jgi:hypothetical protein
MANRKTYLWALYIVALFGIFIASYLAASAGFLVSDHLPRGSWWTGYLLNFAAPLVGGALFGMGFVFWVIRAKRFEPTFRAHFVRTIAWYAFAIWVVGVIYANRDSSDLGLWVQVILWPLMGTVGALIIDLVMTARRRHNLEPGSPPL